jgi:hypothetical protein
MMTEVIAKQVTLDKKYNIEFTEVVRRTSSKDDSEFLTGTFDQFNRAVNGKPQRVFLRFICSNEEVMDLIESAYKNEQRVSILCVDKPNEYVKKDKNGNVVMIDGKELKVYGTQWQIEGFISE